MHTRTFLIDAYLLADETFHFARKALDMRQPAFAHDHDYYELFLLERGSAAHYINGQWQTLSKGALTFVRPSDVHAFQAYASDCQIINVMFRCETAEYLFQRYGVELGQRFFWACTELPESFVLPASKMERAVNALLELQMSRRSQAQIEQFLLYMMTRVIDYEVILPAQTPRWLLAACRAARAPEVFRKGAAGFVEVAGRGHEHVCRMARRHLGQSPSAFVNQVRMEYAARQLSMTDAPVADIASECGIENLSHFYKLFRQSYGNTPHQYRKLHHSNPLQGE